MPSLAITWLGHSSFVVRTPGSRTLLFDPWYTGNPVFPESARPAKADLVLVSHGHSDHVTDAAAITKSTGATLIAIWEVTSWLGTKGVRNLEPMNKGGTITIKGLRITMTDAVHSSSIDDSSTDTPMFTFRVYKGTQNLAEISCTGNEVARGESTVMDCSSIVSGKWNDYDTIKIDDMF